MTYSFEVGQSVRSVAVGAAAAFTGIVESRSVDSDGAEGYVVRDYSRKRWFRDVLDLSEVVG